MFSRAVRSRRNSNSSVEEYEEPEGCARTVGTVRRHTPLDVRDPQGAILHFFVGDSYDPNRSAKRSYISLTLVSCSVLFAIVPLMLFCSLKLYPFSVQHF